MTCPFRGPSPSGLQPEAVASSILGFQSAAPASTPTGGAGHAGGVTHYGTYLGIDKLLSLQDAPAHAKPGGCGIMHHEENTFVIVHQVFELWFKLVITDLRKIRTLLAHSDRATLEHKAFYECTNLLQRVELTLVHATQGFAVIETMHPSDFLEFRDYLVPASGFQSAAFRVLESLLGVADENRATVNSIAVKDYLTTAERGQVRVEETQLSLSALLNKLLASVHVPTGFVAAFLKSVTTVLEQQQYEYAGLPRGDTRAETLIRSSASNISSILEDPAQWCDGLNFNEVEGSTAERDAFRRSFIAALFITSYRHEPRFSQLAQLLDRLVAVEEAILLWRGRHMHMAERMLGRRTGTGGSSGVGYLDITRKYRVFHPLWLVRKVAVRSSALPPYATFGADIPFFDPTSPLTKPSVSA